MLKLTATFSGILLCFFFVACTGANGPSVKKEYLQVFYKGGVTQPAAQKLLDFLYPLWRNEGDSTRPKSVQLTKSGDTVNFRMVIAPEMVSTVTPESIGSFIKLMSDTIFEKAPVNIVLCDAYFKEQKTIRYSKSFSNGPVGSESDIRKEFGTRYSAGTAEVFITPGVDESFGEKLAKYLDESNGSGQVHASFQVLKNGSSFIVKMVTSEEFATRTADSAFTNMANLLSRDIFGNAEVTFVLADSMFRDMKQFTSDAR